MRANGFLRTPIRAQHQAGMTQVEIDETPFAGNPLPSDPYPQTLLISFVPDAGITDIQIAPCWEGELAFIADDMTGFPTAVAQVTAANAASWPLVGDLVLVSRDLGGPGKALKSHLTLIDSAPNVVRYSKVRLTTDFLFTTLASAKLKALAIGGKTVPFEHRLFVIQFLKGDATLPCLVDSQDPAKDVAAQPMPQVVLQTAPAKTVLRIAMSSRSDLPFQWFAPRPEDPVIGNTPLVVAALNSDKGARLNPAHPAHSFVPPRVLFQDAPQAAFEASHWTGPLRATLQAARQDGLTYRRVSVTRPPIDGGTRRFPTRPYPLYQLAWQTEPNGAVESQRLPLEGVLYLPLDDVEYRFFVSRRGDNPPNIVADVDEFGVGLETPGKHFLDLPTLSVVVPFATADRTKTIHVHLLRYDSERVWAAVVELDFGYSKLMAQAKANWGLPKVNRWSIYVPDTPATKQKTTAMKAYSRIHGYIRASAGRHGLAPEFLQAVFMGEKTVLFIEDKWNRPGPPDAYDEDQTINGYAVLGLDRIWDTVVSLGTDGYLASRFDRSRLMNEFTMTSPEDGSTIRSADVIGWEAAVEFVAAELDARLDWMLNAIGKSRTQVSELQRRFLAYARYVSRETTSTAVAAQMSALLKPWQGNNPPAPTNNDSLAVIVQRVRFRVIQRIAVAEWYKSPGCIADMTIAELEGRSLIALSDILASADLPQGVIEASEGIKEVLDRVLVAEASAETISNGFRFGITAVVADELVLGIPGLDAVKLVIGGFGGATVLRIEAAFSGTPESAAFRIAIEDVPLTLRVDSDILRPLVGASDDPDPDAESLDVVVGDVTLEITEAGVNLGFDADLKIPRCMIGSSGIILTVDQARWIAPGADDLPANTPDNFTGLFLDGAKVEFAALGIGDVSMDDVFIGTSGFSGKVMWSDDDLTWNPAGGANGDGAFEGVLAVELAGFDGGLSKFEVEFRQNALVGCAIAGCIYAPYIERVIGLDIGLDGNGAFTAIAQPPTCKFPPGSTAGAGAPNSGYILSADIENVFKFDVSRVEVHVGGGAPASLALSGRVKLSLESFELPAVEFKGLSIDEKGHVAIEGGWLDVDQAKSGPLSGFPIQITRIGFGVEKNGYAWIGLNGGIKLHDILPVGASIEGLKVSWKANAPTLFSLEGIGVELAVEGTFSFVGKAAFFKTEEASGFRATIKLSLDSVGLAIDVGMMVGRMTDGTFFFYLYIGVDLPVGIPLFSTGAAIYGFAGLLAVNLQPARQGDEHWYYGYYKRSPVGVTPPEKWAVKRDAFAVGVGTTHRQHAGHRLRDQRQGAADPVAARAAHSVHRQGQLHREEARQQLGERGHVRSVARARHAGQALSGESGHHVQDGHAARNRRRHRRGVLVVRSAAGRRVARVCRREGAARAPRARQAARSVEGRHRG